MTTRQLVREFVDEVNRLTGSAASAQWDDCDSDERQFWLFVDMRPSMTSHVPDVSVCIRAAKRHAASIAAKYGYDLVWTLLRRPKLKYDRWRNRWLREYAVWHWEYKLTFYGGPDRVTINTNKQTNA